MAELFDRRARVTVDGFRVEGLRVQFRIKKTLKVEPNTLELTVANLAQPSRAKMQSKGTKVVLEAGYKDSIAIAFSGDSRTIDHQHLGPDWITKIQCGDGERAYQYDRINRSFKAGTKRVDVLKAVLKETNLGPGNLVAAVSKALAGHPEHGTYLNGVSFAAPASTVLKAIVGPLGLTYSIQNGELQAVEEEKGLETLFDIGPDTGLVGSPSHGTPDKKGRQSVLKATCFLNAQIQPGHRVFLRSSTATGIYRVEEVEHVGDTAGQDWYTHLGLKPV